MLNLIMYMMLSDLRHDVINLEVYHLGFCFEYNDKLMFVAFEFSLRRECCSIDVDLGMRFLLMIAWASLTILVNKSSSLTSNAHLCSVISGKKSMQNYFIYLISIIIALFHSLNYRSLPFKALTSKDSKYEILV